MRTKTAENVAKTDPKNRDPLQLRCEIACNTWPDTKNLRKIRISRSRMAMGREFVPKNLNN